MPNPLLNDRNVDFLLYELLDVEALCGLPAFSEHSRETFDLYLLSVRKLAREVLYPAYKGMDEQAPRLVEGRVLVHPRMKEIYTRMVEVGILGAARSVESGGQNLPITVAGLAHAYLMAANLSAYGYLGLTTGAARLIESFGDEALKRAYMDRMYAGEWTGTMALSEPQAGSSLSDVKTLASPTGDGYYLIRGSKIFISGGDQDVTENIVHLTLARIEGAPPGTKGITLFAIPRERWEGERLVPNDCKVAGLIHKIGWKGLPSIALNFGEAGDCRGFLVGEPNRGLFYMFQMMNEARLMVGMNGAATAAVAYHEAVEYALTRPQGRPLLARNPLAPQVPIVEHTDVRRMLLRQKAIVEGSLALLATASRYADLALYAETPEERHRAHLLLDLLTPVAKSFPAEKGYEANVLAVQVHGGYGYSSEYMAEAWMRDQKLNSIHEGTTGIQSMDLLGRKVIAEGGAAFHALREEIASSLDRARRIGVPTDWCSKVEGASAALGAVTEHLAGKGMQGDVEGMMRHSYDYLDLFATVAVGWQWLLQAAVAKEGLARGRASTEFYEGKLCAAQYFIHAELPRVGYLAGVCRAGDDAYARMRAEWF
jgi:butyryl-CoA dehydrogenase